MADANLKVDLTVHLIGSMQAVIHSPQVHTYPIGSAAEGSAGAGCVCGWLDPYLWSTELGASIAWAQHALGEVFPDHEVEVSLAD